MGFDEQGFFWLSDPWIAVAVLLAVMSVLLWSHGWVASGRPPSGRMMAIRIRRARRQRPATRFAPARPVAASRPAAGRQQPPIAA